MGNFVGRLIWGGGSSQYALDLARLHREAATLLIRRPSVPFYMQVARSTAAPDSGMGIFLQGSAVSQGQALCLYPGHEIPAPPRAAVTMDGWDGGDLIVREHPESSVYSICLEGGGSIDASAWPDAHHPASIESRTAAAESADAPQAKTVLPRASSSNRSTCATSPDTAESMAERWSDGADNPFVVGHLVNHAGGVRPNVRAAGFSWQHALPLIRTEPSADRIARFAVPNCIVSGFWYVCPTDGSRVQLPSAASTEAESVMDRGVSGLALIALCDIAPGTELLLDYTLTGPPYPSWAAKWYRPAAVAAAVP